MKCNYIFNIKYRIYADIQIQIYRINTNIQYTICCENCSYFTYTVFI